MLTAQSLTVEQRYIRRRRLIKRLRTIERSFLQCVELCDRDDEAVNGFGIHCEYLAKCTKALLDDVETKIQFISKIPAAEKPVRRAAAAATTAISKDLRGWLERSPHGDKSVQSAWKMVESSVVRWTEMDVGME